VLSPPAAAVLPWRARRRFGRADKKRGDEETTTSPIETAAYGLWSAWGARQGSAGIGFDCGRPRAGARQARPLLANR